MNEIWTPGDKKPIKQSMLIVLSSSDPDNGKWDLVKPEDVPEEIKAPDVMGCLVNGELGKVTGQDLWYRAERAETVEV